MGKSKVDTKGMKKTGGSPPFDPRPSAPKAPPPAFVPSGDERLFDFSQLKLIEKPDSLMNRDTLPQTLEDCVGYLKALPLVQPNVDQKNPSTIVDMINILTLPDAEKKLEDAIGFSPEAMFVMSPAEYQQKQTRAFDYQSEPMKGLLQAANRKTSHKKAPLNLGHVILPGNIALYTKYGITYAVPEGRWWLPGPLAHWKPSHRNVSLDNDLITTENGEVLIIRIIEGEVGLITDQGVHKLLDVGTHVFNSGTVKFVGKKTYASDKNFSHGPYHYINVPRGQYAKVWAEAITDGVKSLVPRLLKEGEHFIKSTFFSYNGLVSVSAEYIGHGSVHILNVLKGQVAKIVHDNFPRLLGEGVHIIESPNFEYMGAVRIVDNPYIVHGTITIIQVPQGKIALVWNYNEPYFIDKPGIYEFNSDDVRFMEFVDASQRQIELGSKKVIQVYTGEVGITYNQGELMILPNGRHVIDNSTHIFERFLSTKQRSIRLITYGASEKMARSSKRKHDSSFEMNKDADLLVCETKDLVKVGVRADVFYSITDPEKCIRNLDTDELEDLVRETAVATLTNIIRSTALNQIAQSKQVSASSGPEQLLPAEAVAGEDDNITDTNDAIQQAVTLFFDRAHDEFMSKLHEDFIRRYGVDIANIRMEAFKIMDSELAEQISKHVLTTAQTENELANLEGQSLIATQKERTAAEVQTINAEAEAKSLKTRSDAENDRRIDAAKAEAEAMKIKAMAKVQAEADSILTRAKAQAEAIRLKAVAESERAALLSGTSLGQQESLLAIYADMVKCSNAGVNKVIYMDPSVNRDSPFALGSLDELNRDLHSLSKMGVAASSGSNC